MEVSGMHDLSKMLEDRVPWVVGQLKRKGDMQNRHGLKYNLDRENLSQDKPNQTLHTRNC